MTGVSSKYRLIMASHLIQHPKCRCSSPKHKMNQKASKAWVGQKAERKTHFLGDRLLQLLAAQKRFQINPLLKPNQNHDNGEGDGDGYGDGDGGGEGH